METKRICPECRRPLTDDAPQGLCPECLVKAGLGSGVDIGTETKSGQHHFIATSPEELAGRFPQLEIIGFIGQGGMGAVYKARQRQLNRIVALKILPPGIGEDPEFAQRFAREAKALALLDHPGIVTIHDFGQADGLFFFLMEFVDGLNLRQLLQSGRISPREALAIVPQICDALQYAHDEGIVHRDIKPENVLIDRRGRVKVADFGLAKLVENGNESGFEGQSATTPATLTEMGKVIGTPNYIAPEQMNHPGSVDHRADIYALGVVLYQMLTGELPGKPLKAPSSKVQIDLRLDEVVLRALEGDPERRYQQASHVKTAVESITQTERPAPGRRRRIALTAPVVFSVLCLAAILGWLLKHRMEASSDVLSQYDFEQLVESNRITQAALTYNPQNPLLTDVAGKYLKLENGQRVEVPFHAKVRLYPKLGEKLLSLPPAGISSRGTDPTEAKLEAATKPTQIPEWVKLKPLTGWITDLQSPDLDVQKLAQRAITESGTNLLPEFLKTLKDTTSRGDARQCSNTVVAMRFIGSGQSAIPSFVSLLVSGNDESAYAGAWALAFSAPDFPEAFAQLTNGLVSTSPVVRAAASQGVSLILELETNHLAESALRTLLHNLNDDASFVRADAASTLMRYAQSQIAHGGDGKPDLIIPAVIKLLQDDDSNVRDYGAMVLRGYGKEAAPILLGLTNNQDKQVRECATNGLAIIGYTLSNGTSNLTDQTQATASTLTNSLLQFRLVVESEVNGPSETLPDLNNRKMELEATILLNETAVALARIERSQNPAIYPWHIDLEFTPEGSRQFAEITRTNINRRLAVVYRDQILMAPVIRTEINNGHCSIDGNFSESQLADIAWHLNHAASETDRTPKENPFTARLVSPYLGGTNLRNLSTNLFRPNDLLDLDHQRVFGLPPEWTDWSELRQCRWLRESNVNVAVDLRPEGPIRIVAFDTRLSRVEKGTLPSPPKRAQVLEFLATSSAGLDHQTNVFGIERAVYSVAITNTLPVEFAFRSAEGSVGILELVTVDTNLPPSATVRTFSLSPSSRNRKSGSRVEDLEP